MEGRWLFLYVRAAACASRCRHCCYRADGTERSMPVERIRRILEPFVEAGEGLAVSVADSPLNYPELPDLNRYLRERGVEGWMSVPANGFRLRCAQEWRGLLRALRDAGTGTLELTLYGVEETHDRFARRPGDWDGIHTLADLWRKAGGTILWGLVPTKENLGELSALRELFATRDEPVMPAQAFSFCGAGTRSEQLRLEAGDLDRLDEQTRADFSALKAEGDWIAELEGSEAAPHPADPPVRHATLEPDGTARIAYRPAADGLAGLPIGSLPETPAAEFLAAWDQEYDRWRGGFPSLGELAREFGDRAGTKLHTRESVVRKWEAAQLANAR
jgi:hypothetical protein